MSDVSFPRVRGAVRGLPLAALALLAACDGFEPKSFVQASEIDPNAPGFFSGANGNVVLFDSAATRTNGTGLALGAASGANTTEERILLPDGRIMVRRITVEEDIIEPGA